MQICLFHEYHTDRSPERLAYCDISDISNINYDPESPLYAVLVMSLKNSLNYCINSVLVIVGV